MVKRMLVGNGLFGGYPPNAPSGIAVENSNILELMAKGEKNIPTSPEEVFKDKVIEGDYDIPWEIKARPARIVYEGTVSAGGYPGGKGYGDVLERDPQAVVNDVRAEIISEWIAHNVYHVEYDTELWLADEEKTAGLRNKERENRLQRGKSYDEFEKEWLKRRPPENQLEYYGSWPDAKPLKRIIRL